MVDNHHVSHRPIQQRRCLIWFGDTQQLVIGIHRFGIDPPPLPELGAEWNTEVDAAIDAEVVQSGDSGVGAGHGGHVKGNIGAEAFAEENHAGTSISRHCADAIADAFEH